MENSGRSEIYPSPWDQPEDASLATMYSIFVIVDEKKNFAYGPRDVGDVPVFFLGVPCHAESWWWLPISFCRSHRNVAACPIVVYNLNQNHNDILNC